MPSLSYKIIHWSLLTKSFMILQTVFVHKLALAEATGEPLSSVASHVAFQVA